MVWKNGGYTMGFQIMRNCVLISMLKLCLGFLTDNELAGKIKHFIHADILVLVSAFVVVVGADHC